MEDGGELDHPVGESVQRVRNPRLEISECLDALRKVVVVLGEICGRNDRGRLSTSQIHLAKEGLHRQKVHLVTDAARVGCPTYLLRVP